MSEARPLIDQQKLSIIQEVFGQKYWYQHNQGGCFDFHQSTDLVAEFLKPNFSRITGALVRQGIREAITPNFLSQANETSFIHGLSELSNQHPSSSLYLWTMGDVDWQNYKVKTSTAIDHIPIGNLLIGSQEKLSFFPTLFKSHPCTNFIIIDDKPKNLEVVMTLESQAQESQITMGSYHLKLHDHQANPNACLDYLKQRFNQSNPVVLIVDFDGVIYRTDEALLQSGAQNILRLATISQASSQTFP